MANCSNSASTSRRAASANTCCAAASRRLRPGALFWRTRSSWSPSTPSRCPRSVSRWDEKVLYVFLVLAHDRRRILHFNVTAHSTAEWTGQQLREAFPFDQLPRYLLRDRDAIFGDAFRGQVRDMGIQEVRCTPIPLAAGLRRAHDWFEPARVPGPCARVRRTLSTS